MFETGEIVFLKSGSSRLTVVASDDDDTQVSCFDQSTMQLRWFILPTECFVAK